MQDFYEEYANEAFRQMDNTESGSITIEDFLFIMKSIRSHKLTPELSENLEQVNTKEIFIMLFLWLIKSVHIGFLSERDLMIDHSYFNFLRNFE